MEEMLMMTNGVYENQLNVFITIGAVLYGDVPFFDFNDSPFNDGGCKIQLSMSDQLYAMKDWNTAWKKVNQKIYTLLSYHIYSLVCVVSVYVCLKMLYIYFGIQKVFVLKKSLMVFFVVCIKYDC